jgi:peptidoglycan-associated lipoprotein
MLGGSGGFGYTVKDSPYSVVADVAFLHAGTITGTGYNLNILAVTGGVRYRLPVKRRDVQPFAQGLVGIAHASGTGAQAPNPAAGNAGASLALTAGGGLELPVSPRFTVRLFEADYLLTTFDNGSNNKQNNLRFSFGAVFRF